MKKLLLFPVLLLISMTAFSQKSNAIKLNLLSPLFRTGNLQYERAIGDKSSLQLGVFYTSYSEEITTFQGLGITPEFRFYPGGTPMDGFFVGPFVRYRNFELSDDADNSGTLSLIGGGLIVGRQWIFGEAITFELFIGPMFSSGNFKLEEGSTGDSIESDFFDGFGARAGLTVGFAF